MERSGRNTRPDVYNRGVPLPILGIPSTGLEVDLVNYGRVEQFVETARDPGWNGDAINEVGVLGVLPANMDLAGRGAGRSGNRLLDDLGGGEGR